MVYSIRLFSPKLMCSCQFMPVLAARNTRREADNYLRNEQLSFVIFRGVTHGGNDFARFRFPRQRTVEFMARALATKVSRHRAAHGNPIRRPTRRLVAH